MAKKVPKRVARKRATSVAKKALKRHKVKGKKASKVLKQAAKAAYGPTRKGRDKKARAKARQVAKKA